MYLLLVHKTIFVSGMPKTEQNSSESTTPTASATV